MGVLVDTGHHPLYVPDRRDLPTISGERTDVRGNVGIEPLDEAAAEQRAEFVYGQPFDAWEGYLAHPDHHRYATLSSERAVSFIDAANQLDVELNTHAWTARAIAAVKAIHEVVSSPYEATAVALEMPYAQWAKDDKTLPVFVGWTLQLLHAYDYDDQEPWHIIRDDFNDEYANPDDVHGTIIRAGYGAVPLMVVERSVVVHEGDERVLKRRIEVVKKYKPKTAQATLNQFSLVERRRAEWVLEDEGATERERAAVLRHANRTTVQSDDDLRAWLSWHRNPLEVSWRNRVADAVSWAIAKVQKPPRWYDRIEDTVKSWRSRSVAD